MTGLGSMRLAKLRSRAVKKVPQELDFLWHVNLLIGGTYLQVVSPLEEQECLKPVQVILSAISFFLLHLMSLACYTCRVLSLWTVLQQLQGHIYTEPR